MKRRCGNSRVRKMFIGGLISGLAPLAIQGITALFNKGKRKREEREFEEQEKQTAKLNEYVSDSMALQSYDNLFNAAQGGVLPTGTDKSLQSFLEAAQVNGGSQMLNSNMAKMDGPSHANNGIAMDANLDGSIDTEVEGGEVMQEDRVYSKRNNPSPEFMEFMKEEGFKTFKGSYAKIADGLGMLKGKFERKLEEQIDEASINTAQLLLARIDSILNALFYDQEASK